MRTIKRPDQFEAVVRLLAETPHPVTGRSIFSTMRELLCFAAVLGFAQARRTPLAQVKNEIDGRIFENSQQALDLIYLIALADAKDASILQPDREDEMLRVFEEYAATGLGVIDTWLKERPDDVYGDQAILSALKRNGYLQVDEKATVIDPGTVIF